MRPLPGDTSLVHAASIFLGDFAPRDGARRRGVHRRGAHVPARPDHPRRHALRPRDAEPARPRLGRRARSGAAIGFVGVWLPFVVGYKALRGRAGMGLGDAKLDDARGRVVRLAGRRLRDLRRARCRRRVAAGVLVARARQDRGARERAQGPRGDPEGRGGGRRGGEASSSRRTRWRSSRRKGILAARLPFGPFLCLAIIEWMLAGEWIRDRWLPVLGL